MTDYRLTEAFLAKCAVANLGMEMEEAVTVTAYFLEISRAMNLITTARMELAEQDAHILDLAGKGIPRATIAIRISQSRSLVFKALKRHQRARREAMGRHKLARREALKATA